MYISILHTKWLLYCSKHSFSNLEPSASSDWQATSANTYLHCFIIRQLVRASSTSQNRWRLQHCHIPSDSPATKDASFYVKSIIKVTVCKLLSRAYIIVSLIVCKYIHVRKATDWQPYYTRNDHYSTNDSSFLQVEMKYDFWSAAQYVNPFVEQLQCSVCALSGVEKNSYTSDLLGSTHPTSYVV